jgi:hypothetical protein
MQSQNYKEYNFGKPVLEKYSTILINRGSFSIQTGPRVVSEIEATLKLV